MKRLIGLMLIMLSVNLAYSAQKNESMNYLANLKFKMLDFPSNQFIKVATPKNQVVLHHTASGRGVNGDFRTWLNDPKRIATCVIIDSNGVVNQLYNSKYWGYHLGIKKSVFTSKDIAYQNLNESTIGVEIDSWGGLKKVNGEWRAWPNKYGKGNLTDKKGNKIKVVVPEDRIVFYKDGFRGYNAFEKYTPEQIDTVKTLLKHWSVVYNIPLNYNEDMWDVTDRALKGEPGVFTHVSYRSDKSDCHPQKELVEMLKSIC